MRHPIAKVFDFDFALIAVRDDVPVGGLPLSIEKGVKIEKG